MPNQSTSKENEAIEWRISDINNTDVRFFTGTEQECKEYISKLTESGSRAHSYRPKDGWASVRKGQADE